MNRLVACQHFRHYLQQQIGDQVIELSALPLPAPDGVFAAPSLNRFFALGRSVRDGVRSALRELLEGPDSASLDRAVVARADVEMLLPVQVGDYVDFYASLHHATNLGRHFRPGSEPLLPNWRHLPVAYHGRSGTVVPSGTPVVRPHGQVVRGESPPALAPTAALDVELEVDALVK